MQWIGEAGVELFFSLSGFLIGGILVADSQASFGLQRVSQFWFRRWMRTLPAYYVALGFSCWFWEVPDFPAYGFLQNFHPEERHALVVSWSLVLEEFFYVFFPLAMLALAPLIGRGARLVAVTALGLIATCVAGRLANVYGLQHVTISVAHRHPFMRMDCAAYGVLAACLVRSRPGLARWMSSGRAAWMLGGSLGLAAFWGGLFMAVVFLPSEALVRLGFATWGLPYFAFQDSALNMMFAATILALFFVRLELPGWLSWCVRQLSLISYSVYLFHVLVVGALDRYLPGAPGLGRLVLLVTAVLVFGSLSYHGIEQPFLRLRDRVAPSRRFMAKEPI